MGSKLHDPAQLREAQKDTRFCSPSDLNGPAMPYRPCTAVTQLTITHSHHNQLSIPENLSPLNLVSTSMIMNSFPFCVRIRHFRSLLLRVTITKIDLTKLLVKTIRLLRGTRNLTIDDSHVIEHYLFPSRNLFVVLSQPNEKKIRRAWTKNTQCATLCVRKRGKKITGICYCRTYLKDKVENKGGEQIE